MPDHHTNFKQKKYFNYVAARGELLSSGIAYIV